MQKVKHKILKKKSNINTAQENSVFRSLLNGLIYGYFFTAVCLIIMALLLTYSSLFSTDSQSAVAIIIVTILAVVITGYKTAVTYHSKGWMWGTISGVLYLIILIILSYLFNKDFGIKSSVFSTFLLCLGSGALGGILGDRKNRE